MLRAFFPYCVVAILVAGVVPAAAGDLTVAAGEPVESSLSAAEAKGDASGDPSQPIRHDSSETITLVLVGDTGLNGSMQPVRADAALRHGRVIPWAEATRDIKAEINGDLNFANLETVVTERNGLRALAKSYNFRSHPDGVRYLVKAGLNLLSTANNHAFDFGPEGARDTLLHLNRMRADGLLASAGLGLGRDAAAEPQPIETKGARILLSAVGIGPGGFGGRGSRAGSVGQMAFSSDQDFNDTVSRLGAGAADYKILSAHFGTELDVAPSASDVRKLRESTVKGGDIDLVVGHHAHVVAGVESVGGKLIFYGLGNFLHQGMQDMAKFGMCRDYGLLARVYLAKSGNGRLEAKAVEVVPLKDMHEAPQRRNAREAGERVEVLNFLARQLDNAASGARGVRFTVQSSGSGLYCAPGAGDVPGEIGLMCKGWAEPGAAAPETLRRIANSCGGRSLVASRRNRDPGESSETASAWPGVKAKAASAARQRVTAKPAFSLFGF